MHGGPWREAGKKLVSWVLESVIVRTLQRGPCSDCRGLNLLRARVIESRGAVVARFGVPLGLLGRRRERENGLNGSSGARKVKTLAGNVKNANLGLRYRMSYDGTCKGRGA